MIDDDLKAFWTLRDAPLHDYGAAQWVTYDPAMAAWLYHSDQSIRGYAIERLCMAVLSWDYRRSEEAAARNAQLPRRLQWLLSEIEEANARSPDIIPAFLRNLRYHGHDAHIAPTILDWIARVVSSEPPKADMGLIGGTRLLLEVDGPLSHERFQDLVAKLDDPSPYLRGCAASLLGAQLDSIEDMEANGDGFPTLKEMRDLIGEKEIARPGVAGPFWSQNHFSFGMAPEEIQDWTLWMLDLLERRSADVPAFEEMPYNDIDFYLHEMCCADPHLVERMLDKGFAELAVMTATEIDAPVEGMKRVLERLSDSPLANVSSAARRHLTQHYS
jgi:hypothetical protein